MNIVKAGFEILPRDEVDGSMKLIELAGRTCYKSEGKITDGSAEKFVKMCIERHHDAMLEHGDYIFEITQHAEAALQNVLKRMDYCLARPRIKVTDFYGLRLASGNIRAWREFLHNNTEWAAPQYFIGLIHSCYREDIEKPFYDTGSIKRIYYADLTKPLEQLQHIRETVRFTVDRGVSHELVRHRNFSFAQESTRYCNYSQDKFGNQITVIEPCYLENAHEGRLYWRYACETAEREYFRLLDFGCTPQEARAILPMSLKTEVVMTGTLADWQHFFDLRAKELTGPVHPQMAEVAKPLFEAFKEKYPNIFT